MRTYDLKFLAEAGYVMGLPTIGQVASHMHAHHYAYFTTDNLAHELGAFDELIEGHDDDLILNYLSEDDIKRMDDELERMMNAEKAPPEDLEDNEEL